MLFHFLFHIICDWCLSILIDTLARLCVRRLVQKFGSSLFIEWESVCRILLGCAAAVLQSHPRSSLRDVLHDCLDSIHTHNVSKHEPELVLEVLSTCKVKLLNIGNNASYSPLVGSILSIEINLEYCQQTYFNLKYYIHILRV